MAEEQNSWRLRTAALSEEERARLLADQLGRPQSGLSLLLFVRDGVRTLPLVEGGGMVIGRDAPADVVVEEEGLSRQHAHVELVDGAVWVEDLESTNGTWVDGERVRRAHVPPGTRLEFGTVGAAVRAVVPGQRSDLDLASHDRLRHELELEMERSQATGRPVALLMLRGRSGPDHVSTWLSSCSARLRRYDRIALYAPDTVEVLLVESGASEAERFAQAMVGGGIPLFVGAAVFPEHAGCADELIGRARVALLDARDDTPVRVWDATATAEASAPGAEPVIAGQAMQAVMTMVERVADSALPVLLVGETGTGKEVLARTIHERSGRHEKAMVSVNCGAIPADLVESTLFGHEKGAFTGAGARATGVFEAADGGSVLLDEIGELPPAAQASLLRVLEGKRFHRVGSTQEIAVDVRMLAATHKDLEAMVGEGSFRQDLLFRLNAMTLAVPPLRERRDEIEPLAARFMREANEANGSAVQRIAADARELLLHHTWPGNVRELRNVIERAVVIARGDTITVDDLPDRIREVSALAPSPVANGSGDEADELGEPISLKAELNRFEASLILRALRQTNWDRSAAAELLGIPLRTLAHKIGVHEINRE